jgi:hypothetical protein
MANLHPFGLLTGTDLFRELGPGLGKAGQYSKLVRHALWPARRYGRS